MIATIDVTLQSANPALKLFPMRAFQDSPSSFRIRNVPKRIGEWNISSVTVTVLSPDGSQSSAEAKLTGGVYVATVPGCGTLGTVENGYTVFAAGKDENGNEVTGYILGKGDVEILDPAGISHPGEGGHFVSILSAQPETPKEGDLWQVSGTWFVFQDGEAWALGDDTGLINQLSAEIQTKQAQLTNDQLKAVNSGITAAKVAQIGEWQYPFTNIQASEQPPTWTYSGYDVTLYEVGNEPYFDISLGVWQMSLVPIADPGDVFFLTANGDEQSTILNFYGDEVHPVSLTATQYLYQRVDVTSHRNNTLLSSYFQPGMPIVFGSVMGDNTRMDDLYLTVDGTALTSDLSIDFNSSYVITQNRFHPRNDAETDFVIKAGCWNVFMIFEYRERHFMVSRWTETEGGAE